jgi:hypothetical protein
MAIDKAKVVALLRRRGLDDRAAWVDRQLPAHFDMYDNAGLLAMLNIDPDEVGEEAPGGMQPADPRDVG